MPGGEINTTAVMFVTTVFETRRQQKATWVAFCNCLLTFLQEYATLKMKMKTLRNLQELQQGFHSLEEVLKMAGFHEEKQEAYLTPEGTCSICGKPAEIIEEEDNDPVNGFQVWRKAVCPIHGQLSSRN